VSGCEAIWGGIIFATMAVLFVLAVRATRGHERMDKKK
jgi:hypothetical protein